MDQRRRHLKQLREEKGLKNGELAKRANIAYSSLSNIEAGRFVPSAGVLARILVALDASDAEVALVVRGFAA